jgi:hypothetical protein
MKNLMIVVLTTVVSMSTFADTNKECKKVKGENKMELMSMISNQAVCISEKAKIVSTDLSNKAKLFYTNKEVTMNTFITTASASTLAGVSAIVTPTAVAHSSGTLILTGASGYVAGTIGATATVVSALPVICMVAGVATVVAVGVYYKESL